LAFKYFGPFKIINRVGSVAYRLELPPDCQVHPVFHISQLKEFGPGFAPIFQAVPPPIVFKQGSAQPVAILQRRMVQQGNVAATQVLIQWSGLPEEYATWEDYEVLRRRFPAAAIWEAVPVQGGATVMPSDPSEDDNEETDQG
jgi:hypothetical protein